MKKASLLTALTAACFLHAQIKFEKGYYIDNSGQKVEVLIKNLDWKNNPTEFEYKIDENSEIKKETIKNIQEFATDHNDKYIRKTIMLDTSSDQLNNISEIREPQFTEQTIFLKYQVEGKANLFYYENSDTRRFFFNVDGSEVQQLIYKPYLINESRIAYNENYKKQLQDNLKCGIENKDIETSKYNRKDITELFMKYNSCSDGSSFNYTKASDKKDLFNLSIRPGISSSSLKTMYTSYNSTEDTKFDNKTTFRIGVELEFILPFNRNKWSIFAEPTYQYYKSEMEVLRYPGTYFEQKFNRSVDYKSIEVPIGVRHYFFLNDKSKIFINAAYLLDFNFKSNIKYDYFELETNSGNNLIFGAGYKYNDKFGVEFRVGTPRTLLRNYYSWNSDYTTMSLIFGYTLF